MAKKKDASELLRDYAGGMTLRQCARKHGISPQRVHQIIEKRAPEMMRNRAEAGPMQTINDELIYLVLELKKQVLALSKDIAALKGADPLGPMFKYPAYQRQQRQPAAKRQRRGRRRIDWTEQDVGMLKELAGTTPMPQIASKLGRTKAAVQQKALTLGLSLRTTGAGRRKKKAVRSRFGLPTKRTTKEQVAEQAYEQAVQQYERIVSEAGNRIVPRFNSGGHA